MKHIIFFKGTSICPHCGGMLRLSKSDEIILNCIDCGTFFRAIGEGNAESELEFEEAGFPLNNYKSIINTINN